MTTLPPCLLIGASGQVSRALESSLKGRGASVLRTSSQSGAADRALDLGDPASIRACLHEVAQRAPGRPGEVFLVGAITHVDRCEEESERCRNVNQEGPRVVAEECERHGFSLTYLSTEYVFGGAEISGGAIGPFSEVDPPAPVSWYGRCKLGGERAVQAILGEQALIVRTTMVFSFDPSGMNFLMQYLRQLEEIRAGRQPAIFKIPEDQISTPTYAPALAEAICHLRGKEIGGVVNVVGKDLLSRPALVEKVIDAFGFAREPSLAGFQFLPTAKLQQRAQRPLSAGLKMGKAESLGVKAWSLHEALADAKKAREAFAARA